MREANVLPTHARGGGSTGGSDGDDGDGQGGRFWPLRPGPLGAALISEPQANKFLGAEKPFSLENHAKTVKSCVIAIISSDARSWTVLLFSRRRPNHSGLLLVLLTRLLLWPRQQHCSGAFGSPDSPTAAQTSVRNAHAKWS